MNRIKELRKYNDFLKSKYIGDEYLIDEDLLEYLESIDDELEEE